MSLGFTAWALLAAGVFAALLRATTPILLASLGALISDLAGCLNVALEGLMLIAAFFGVMGAVQAAGAWPALPPWSHALLGAGAGLLAALLLTALLAFFHLELGADLIVAGIAVNLLAAGLTVFLLAGWVGDKGSTAALASPALPGLRVPGLSAWPVLERWVNGDADRGHHVLVLAAFVAVPAVWLLLHRTQLGRWLRAVGENPQAALSAGIPVKRVHYAALLLSGGLAGLAGVYLSLGYLTLFQADMSAGRGFLALAAVFLGARRLLGVLGAALLFGASAVLATRLGALSLPPQLLQMLPPFITLCALALAGRRKASPTT